MLAVQSGPADSAGGPVVQENLAVEDFLNCMWRERGLSDSTLAAYRKDLLTFASFLQESGLSLEQAEQGSVMDYLGRRQASGISRSAARSLSAIRNFYRYLLRENRIREDPTLRIIDLGMGRVCRKPWARMKWNLSWRFQIAAVILACGTAPCWKFSMPAVFA